MAGHVSVIGLANDLTKNYVSNDFYFCIIRNNIFLLIIIFVALCLHACVGRRAIIRRYKVLLNVEILYCITLYFRFRFCYRLVFVVFY